MFTIFGTPCPVPEENELIAVSAGGNLVTVNRRFPGAVRSGPLFASPAQAEEFRRELWARACERLAGQCATLDRYTTGQFIQDQQALAAARLCRQGKFHHPVVRDVIRFAGPVSWEWASYDIALPEGAIDG